MSPPPIILWENVPGVLSTKDNAFGCFMAGLCGSDVPLTVQNGKWPNAGIVAGPKRKIAWRTLNAKYFGVPQQRKRIFVIASSREDFDPAKILFELPRVCGTSNQSDSERQDITAFSESSFGTFRKSRSAAPVRAAGGTGGGGSETIIIDISHADDVIRESKNLVPTLKARMGTGGNNVPCLMDQGGSIMTVHNNMTGTLRAESHGHEPIIEHRSETTPTICIAENTIGRKAENGGNGIGTKINTSFTLNATGVHGVCDRSSLRRLTPLECERLQGFPDNWTKIAYKGKTVENCPDSPRYKAIGNSWAVPVVRWIGQRIQDALIGKHDEK